MFFLFFFFFNSLSNFFFWVMLEVNMTIFICLFFFSSFFSIKQELYEFSLFYFILQSLGSIFFLFFISQDNLFSFSLLECGVVLSLSLKSALFPFSWWLFYSGKILPSYVVAFLLTLQKIPIFIFLFNSLNFSFFILSLISIFYGAFGVMSSYFWFSLIFFSSLYSTIWFFFTYMMSNFMFFHFFFIYTFFVFFFSSVYSMNFQLKSTDSVTFCFIFMFFLGLPPLSAFFFKFYFISFFWNQMGVFFFLFIWSGTFLALFGYFKFLYEFFFFMKSFYNMVPTRNLMFFFLGLGLFPQIFFFSGKLY